MLKEFGYEHYKCSHCGQDYARLKLSDIPQEDDICPPCSNKEIKKGKCTK